MPGFEAWSAAALATDPVGSKQDPPVLRSPAGVFQDARNYWQAGRPYYDPARIKVPTLVMVAEWDELIPPRARKPFSTSSRAARTSGSS